MTDAKTLAYINLYGILGALENLCELDEEASKLAQVKKPVSVGISVKGGPSATLTFKNGRCRMEQGTANCDVLLPFSSCEKFNGLIDGTVTPIPSKGFTKIGFLLNNFTKLTTDVPDSTFEIPDGYGYINLSWLSMMENAG